ncbi:MAG: formimidoylglutamase, partial [Steroidobacteraceae bacterium]
PDSLATQRAAMPWRGREDDAEAGQRWHRVIDTDGSGQAPVMLTGFACDAGVRRNRGRPGARHGPAALRQALASLPVHQVEAAVDLGDVDCAEELEAGQVLHAERVAAAVQPGRMVFALGGGHEIAWPSWLGLSRGCPEGLIAVINFDAHLDLRGDAEANSGTGFRQIMEAAASERRQVEYLCIGASRFANLSGLYDRARRLGAQWVSDEALHRDGVDAALPAIEALLSRASHVHLSLCLDVFPGSCAPGVSAPAALGVAPEVVEQLLDPIIGSGKCRLADVAELSPPHDPDGRTARLAARMLAHMAEGHCQAIRRPAL